MATIFPDPTNVAIRSFKRDSVRVPVTWPHRIALIISGNITVGSITGTETFNVEFSGGGPVTINTLSAPYANLGALQSSFQSQIDFALGAGVGILINLNDQRIGFLDTDYYNGFVYKKEWENLCKTALLKLISKKGFGKNIEIQIDKKGKRHGTTSLCLSKEELKDLKNKINGEIAL